jgi:hypothetical protein
MANKPGKYDPTDFIPSLSGLWPQYLRKSTKRIQSFEMSGKSDQKSPNGKISGDMLLVYHVER